MVFEKNSATLNVDSAFSSLRYPFLIKSSESALVATEANCLLATESTSMR